MRYLMLFALLAVVVATPVTAQVVTKAVTGGENFHPSISEDGNHIVFIKESRALSDVYVMDAWNLTPTKLTTLGNITFPGGCAVSGDGKQLAFVAGKNVWTMPTAGGTPKKVTKYSGTQSAIRDVVLSRDGSKIGFTTFDSTSSIYEFAVADAVSSSVKYLTGATLKNDYLYGTMSSDGSLVAFTAKRGGTDTHVWFVGTDGKNLRKATTLKVRSYTYPSLDRRATRCAFVVEPTNGNWEVYTVKTDGTGQVNISQNSTGKDTSPRLSADGDRVVWKSQRGVNKYGDVYMAYPDGTGLRRAIKVNGIPPGTVNASLAVNGDGSIIVFSSNYFGGGAYELFVWMDALTRSAATAPAPGKQIALILQNKNSAGGTYVMASAFGRSPGINLGSAGTVPLTPDALFFFSQQAPSVFVNFAGVFNTSGQAGAFINIPNIPALKGFGFYTSAVGVTGTTTKIFNPILITIE